MLISIDAVITEVARIPRATWTMADPTSPPVLRPRSAAGPVPVGHGPVFDDAGFAPPSSTRWREAVDAVGRQVGADAGGAAPRGPVGADAVAWYVSFHGSPDQWGIYGYKLHVRRIPGGLLGPALATHGALLMGCAGPVFQPGPLRDFCDRLLG